MFFSFLRWENANHGSGGCLMDRWALSPSVIETSSAKIANWDLSPWYACKIPFSHSNYAAGPSIYPVHKPSYYMLFSMQDIKFLSSLVTRWFHPKKIRNKKRVYNFFLRKRVKNLTGLSKPKFFFWANKYLGPMGPVYRIREHDLPPRPPQFSSLRSPFPHETKTNPARRSGGAGGGRSRRREKEQGEAAEMDPDAVKSTLSNLAFGNVIAAAARDLQKVTRWITRHLRPPVSQRRLALPRILLWSRRRIAELADEASPWISRLARADVEFIQPFFLSE